MPVPCRTMSDPVTEVMMALHPAVEIDDTSPLTGRAMFAPHAAHRGIEGLLHGGLAATVLDHVCARTASAALGLHVVTGKLDVRYPQPVTLAGGPYEVLAKAEKPRGRTVRVSGAIVDADGRPMVEAKTLFVARS